MMPLNVMIIGSGKAAAKHEQAFSMMNRKWRVVDDLDSADMVSICSAHYRHYDQIMQFIDMGLGIIVEKPMCGSLSDADEIIRKAELCNVGVYPVFQYRYADHSGFEEVLMLSFKRDRKYWNGWRSDWDRSYGGALVMHGIHALDLVAAAVGMPDALKCQLTGPKELNVETRALVTMQWQTGQQFQIAIAADWELGESELIMPWSEGASPTAYLKLFDAIYDDVNYGPEIKTVKGMFRAHIEKSEDERLPTIADARNSIELVTMCYKSHIYGMFVERIQSSDVFYHGWTDLCKKWYGTPEPEYPILQ